MQMPDLKPEEVEALRELLGSSIVDMDREVMRTDSHDFKSMLKHRREILESIMVKLEAMAPA